MTLNISNQIGEAKLIVETNIAFTSSVFPRIPRSAKASAEGRNYSYQGASIYIEIAILDESEATHRKTDPEPQQ